MIFLVAIFQKLYGQFSELKTMQPAYPQTLKVLEYFDKIFLFDEDRHYLPVIYNVS